MKTICNKHSVNLYEQDNILLIDLDITNDKLDLKKYCSFNFFDTLQIMNKNLIESCELIEQHSEYENTHLLILKSFNEDLGLPKHYICFNTVIEHCNNKVTTFTSKSVDIPEEHRERVKNYELLSFNISDIYLYFSDNLHHVNIRYKFQFDKFDTFPQFVQRLISLTIKQLYINLKIFIESI